MTPNPMTRTGRCAAGTVTPANRTAAGAATRTRSVTVRRIKNDRLAAVRYIWAFATTKAAPGVWIEGSDDSGSPAGSFQNAFVAAQAGLPHPDVTELTSHYYPLSDLQQLQQPDDRATARHQRAQQRDLARGRRGGPGRQARCPVTV
jgi:hypothetical protein